MRSTLRFKSRMSARTSLRSSRISDSQPAKPCSTAPRRLPRRQAAPLTAKTIVAPTVAMAMMIGVASKVVLLVRQPRDAGAFRHYARGPWLGRFANPPPTARCLFVSGGVRTRQSGGYTHRRAVCESVRRVVEGVAPGCGRLSGSSHGCRTRKLPSPSRRLPADCRVAKPRR